ncbi:MAG: peptidylprolyl isomerase [Myxococcaceae bacterium]|nr:peptidylprolyl isomerase [Myxococcaceae bacterium]
MIRPLLVAALALPLLALAQAKPEQKPAPAAPGKWTQKVLAGTDLYATLRTSEGDVVVRLFSKDAPKTVANFVGLAAGEKEWRDPKSGQMSRKPFYAGLVFHRVIPGFMIQGGDPTGTGRGDPGYRFEDEFQSGRAFDRPGLLAMANAGPNTNGSQFFITVAPTPHLTHRHTIFGEVVKGYETAVKISEVKAGSGSRPSKDVVIKSIQLSEKPPKGVASAKPVKKQGTGP